MLLFETRASPDSGYLVPLKDSKLDLQESVACMADIMKELVQLKLAKYMPLSMSVLVVHSCIPYPWLTH
jgi:hypothetical protein